MPTLPADMRRRFDCRRLLVCLSPCLLVFGAALPCQADVIVLANRTRGTVRVQVKPTAAPAMNLALAPRDVVPLFVDGRANVSFSAGGRTQQYTCDANSAYYFGQADGGRVDLQRIGLGDDPRMADGQPLPGRAATTASWTIPVKLLVDEEEPARRPMWERRLRQRIEAASQILNKYCRVQLKVVAVETWNSDNATTDFFASLDEFEREVKPFPARLVIGFTSQYQVTRGRTHMAGTRGTLHSHILVREWSRRMSEPERLELLVHELGHHLGASHSPEPDSVMRPVLGSNPATQAGFQVRFDPVNALVIGMIGEELRRRKVQSVTAMTDYTRRRLQQIYTSLSPTMPEDPAAAQLHRMVTVAPPQPLVLATKQVLAHIAFAAQSNARLPLAAAAAPGQKTRREGDALADYYVQTAAGIARFLPAEVAPSALLLGLGIALGDASALDKDAKMAAFVARVDSPNERSLRERSLGQPTIRGRTELVEPFFRSVLRTAVIGSQAANEAARDEQLANSNTPRGLSFAELAAGRAGTLFAGGVMNRRFALPALGSGFSAAAYLPVVDDLPEALTAAALDAQFGPPTDERFRQQLAAIDQRVLQLPVYRGVGVALEGSGGTPRRPRPAGE